MKRSILTPVVVMLPGQHAHWEVSGTIDDVARIAQRADELGYHHMTCSEHVGVPQDLASSRGSRYWDPLATFGYIASRTQRIRLATDVLVLGYHHPLAIAKRYGTLDVVSRGRVVLGVGVGSLEEEFDLLGAGFSDRGPRADEALRALRESLSRRVPTFDGEHYSYDGFVIDPCAQQDQVPLWVGGRSQLSLRRASRLADGWAPFGLSLKQVRSWLDEEPLPASFEVVLRTSRPLDPIGNPTATAGVLSAMAGAGATIVTATFEHQSLDHYLEQLEAFTRVHDTLGDST